MLTCGRDMIAVDIGSGGFNDRERIEKTAFQVMLTSPALWHVGKLRLGRKDPKFEYVASNWPNQIKAIPCSRLQMRANSIAD
jgi:hypothetical protein